MSPSGLHSISLRHSLENFKLRRKDLGAKVAADVGLFLTEAQVQALEKKARWCGLRVSNVSARLPNAEDRKQLKLDWRAKILHLRHKTLWENSEKIDGPHKTGINQALLEFYEFVSEFRIIHFLQILRIFPSLLKMLQIQSNSWYIDLWNIERQRISLWKTKTY